MSEELERIVDAEVVDAEIVQGFQGIRLEQWFSPDKAQQIIRLTITDEWMHRHQDAAWKDLRSILEALREFVNTQQGEVHYDFNRSSR